MGQARLRGTFKQRQAIAIERDTEQRRLDAWLKSRRPTRKYNPSLSILAAALMHNDYVALTRAYYNEQLDD